MAACELAAGWRLAGGDAVAGVGAGAPASVLAERPASAFPFSAAATVPASAGASAGTGLASAGGGVASAGAGFASAGAGLASAGAGFASAGAGFASAGAGGGSLRARLLPDGAGSASATAASLAARAISTGSGGGGGALAMGNGPDRGGIASNPNAQAAAKTAAEVSAATAMAGATTDWRRRPAWSARVCPISNRSIVSEDSRWDASRRACALPSCATCVSSWCSPSISFATASFSSDAREKRFRRAERMFRSPSEGGRGGPRRRGRSEEHTSELQSLAYLVCRLLLEKKKKQRHGLRVPWNTPLHRKAWNNQTATYAARNLHGVTICRHMKLAERMKKRITTGDIAPIMFR